MTFFKMFICFNLAFIAAARTCERGLRALPPRLSERVLRDAGVVAKVRGDDRVDGETVALPDRHRRVALAVAQLHRAKVPVHLREGKEGVL